MARAGPSSENNEFTMQTQNDIKTARYGVTVSLDRRGGLLRIARSRLTGYPRKPSVMTMGGSPARPYKACMHLCADSPSAAPPVVRVVVADDADGPRELICLLLDMESDFTVVGRARDGAEAVNVVADTGPDLVVLDVAMPVMDGFTAFSGVRAAAPRAKVVFFTGSGEAASEKARALGADGLIEKNGSVDTIVPRLRSVCRAESVAAAAAATG